MKRFLFCLTLLATPLTATAQEKPKHATGYRPPSPEKKAALHAEAKKRHGNMMAELAKNVTPPAEFDCKDLNWCVDAGDQASCGSCYLYSTVKQATNSAVKAGVGKLGSFRLSTQYGMDCHDFGGCGGGNGTEVIDWMTKNGWPAEADAAQDSGALYPPYEARSRSCRLPANAKKYMPKSWAFITGDQGDHPATVDEFKVALLTFGTVNVALDAGGQFGNYTGGVIDSLGNNIDHEIIVRGYSDSKQALLLENQWKGWGGAKTPGDNCAWLSYKAVGRLQDPFTVLFATPTPPGTVPVITSATTASAVVGTSFTFQLSATNAPTSFGATALPAGVTLNGGNGLISGTPTATGSFTVALTATNAAGQGTGSLTITVTATPQPPPPPPPGGVSITLTPDQVASVNQQSGALVVTGQTTLQQLVDKVNADSGAVLIHKGMTLEELLKALDKSKQPASPKCCGQDLDPKADDKPNAPAPDDARLKKVEQDSADIKRALDAIMKALLKKE